MDYSQYILSYKDFPKDGIVYWDFTLLLRTPDAFRQAVKDFVSHFQNSNLTAIVAIEAKGFTLAAAIAYEISLPLVLVRKPELIPGEVLKESFEKEYGYAEYHLKKGQLSKQDNALIIYDIMAGAGATQAAINLVQAEGASVAGLGYIIELEYLKGRDELGVQDILSLVKIKEKKIL